MSSPEDRVEYSVPILECNLTSFLPDRKRETGDFLLEICDQLKTKSRVVNAEPTDVGVKVTLVGGISPPQACRITRSIDEIISEIVGRVTSESNSE